MERFISESQQFHGTKATSYGANYQNERTYKSNYILVNVIAEGYDIKRFLEAMVAAKSKTITFVSFSD